LKLVSTALDLSVWLRATFTRWKSPVISQHRPRFRPKVSSQRFQVQSASDQAFLGPKSPFVLEITFSSDGTPLVETAGLKPAGSPVIDEPSTNISRNIPLAAKESTWGAPTKSSGLLLSGWSMDLYQNWWGDMRIRAMLVKLKDFPKAAAIEATPDQAVMKRCNGLRTEVKPEWGYGALASFICLPQVYLQNEI
jgi:hypothetical protein